MSKREAQRQFLGKKRSYYKSSQKEHFESKIVETQNVDE